MVCAPPVVAVGDGALGFWAALREVVPETREQRRRVHQIANVPDKLPKSLQTRAKSQLLAMMSAPTRAECVTLMASFGKEFSAKCPKSVASLEKDPERLLTLLASRGAPEAPAVDEPDRVDLLVGEAADANDARRRIT